MERILVLAPHTDDGEIGCGATIAKFIRQKKAKLYCRIFKLFLKLQNM